MHAKVRRPLELTSLYDDLRTDGRNPSTRVLTLETVRAPDAVARALGVEEGAPVLFMARLRSAGNEPLAVMHNYIPAGLAAFTAEELERTGLYELMRAPGSGRTWPPRPSVPAPPRPPRRGPGRSARVPRC